MSGKRLVRFNGKLLVAVVKKMCKGTVGNNGKGGKILNWNIFINILMDYGKSTVTVVIFTMATKALPQ